MEQPEVQGEAGDTGEQAGDDDVRIAAEIGFHRRHEQPQLQDHQTRYPSEQGTMPVRMLQRRLAPNVPLQA